MLGLSESLASPHPSRIDLGRSILRLSSKFWSYSRLVSQHHAVLPCQLVEEYLAVALEVIGAFAKVVRVQGNTLLSYEHVVLNVVPCHLGHFEHSGRLIKLAPVEKQSLAL